MAYSIVCKLESYEVRNVSNKTTKKGNPFLVVRVESPDGEYNAELQVWDDKAFAAVNSLERGSICDFFVRASAGSDYQGLTYLDHKYIGNAYELSENGGVL